MIPLILWIAIASPQATIVDYAYNHGINPSVLGDMRGVCLVRSTGVGYDSEEPISRHYEEAVVVDSPVLPVGSTVRIVGSYRRGKVETPMYAMRAKQTYLVVGTLPQAGRFVVPPLGSSPIESGADARKSDIYALDVFPTMAKALRRDRNVVDGFFGDLVDCMYGQTVEETGRLYSFMENMRPPQLPYSPFTSYRDTQLTTRIRGFAATYPAVQRAMLYQLLVAWNVRGSQKPFSEALLDIMDDAQAFPTQFAQLDASMTFTRGEPQSDVSAYLAQFPTGNRKVNSLLRGADPYIANYVLNQVPQSAMPDAEHLHKLATWLTQGNQPMDVQMGAAGLLAGVLNRNDLRPVTTFEHGVEKWQNRESTLAVWKDAVKKNLIRTGKVSEIRVP